MVSKKLLIVDPVFKDLILNEISDIRSLHIKAYEQRNLPFAQQDEDLEEKSEEDLTEFLFSGNMVSMELASGAGKTCSIDYTYKNIFVQFTMKRIKEKIFNNEIGLNHDISFHIDRYVEKIGQAYEIKDEEDLNRLLNTFINKVKSLLPSPSPNMNPPMPPNFYGRGVQLGEVQLTTQMNYNEGLEHISQPISSNLTTPHDPYDPSHLPPLNYSMHSNAMISSNFAGPTHALEDLVFPPPRHQQQSIRFPSMMNNNLSNEPSHHYSYMNPHNVHVDDHRLPGHQQQNIHVPSMMNNNLSNEPQHHYFHMYPHTVQYGIEPPRHYSRTYPRPVHVDDHRQRPIPQPIYYTSSPLTISSQSSYGERLDLIGPASQIQTGTIDHDASSTTVPASQLSPRSSNSPTFRAILEECKIPPSNVNANNKQSQP
ncbi:unnamed protein product [Rotaria sordida]|uniref:Uncharacterized protein n=1 Tax=Rotaria sordida TaxID=392033 RepID=A0A815LEI2_9BILA|nr:unnamed protein product [Rotaria sordida]